MQKSLIQGTTLDDVMREAIEELFQHGEEIQATKGNNRELTSILLEVDDPRARLSRTETRGKPFSCLGELCWYLTRAHRLDFITYYIPMYKEFGEGGIVHGGYGPRLFDWGGVNQFSNVTELLRRKPHSRRAVIQLFDAEDLVEHHVDIPCTCSLQFMIRHGKLDLHVSMRSNDAFLGLPHEAFCFTMLQEIMASDLSVDLGRYTHVVGSLHLYESNYESASQFLSEGWQSTRSPMPRMPQGDPWSSIAKLLEAEQKIREMGGVPETIFSGVDPYWCDLIRILQIYRFARDDNRTSIEETLKKMNSGVFNAYIKKKTSQ